MHTTSFCNNFHQEDIAKTLEGQLIQKDRAKKPSRLPNNSKRLWEQRNRPVYQIIQKDGAKKTSRLPNNSKRLWEQRNRPVYQIIQKDYGSKETVPFTK